VLFFTLTIVLRMHWLSAFRAQEERDHARTEHRATAPALAPLLVSRASPGATVMVTLGIPMMALSRWSPRASSAGRAGPADAALPGAAST